jgi:hypothetical protein
MWELCGVAVSGNGMVVLPVVTLLCSSATLVDCPFDLVIIVVLRLEAPC